MNYLNLKKLVRLWSSTELSCHKTLICYRNNQTLFTSQIQLIDTKSVFITTFSSNWKKSCNQLRKQNESFHLFSLIPQYLSSKS